MSTGFASHPWTSGLRLKKSSRRLAPWNCRFHGLIGPSVRLIVERAVLEGATIESRRSERHPWSYFLTRPFYTPS